MIELADILTRLGKETIERSTEGGIKKIDRPIKKETLSDISLFILSNLVNAESKLEIGKALKAIARKRLASYKREKKH